MLKHIFFSFIFLFTLVINIFSQDVEEFGVLSHKDSVEMFSPIPLSYITPQSTKLLADLSDARKKIRQADNLDDLNKKWENLNKDLNEYLEVFHQIKFEQNSLIILFKHQRELESWQDEVKSFLTEVLEKKDALNTKFISTFFIN